MLQTGELIIQRGNLKNGNLTAQTGSLTSGSLSGPATYVSVENDPLFRASAAYTITQEDIDRWNEDAEAGAYFVSYSYLYSYVSDAMNDIDLSEYVSYSYLSDKLIETVKEAVDTATEYSDESLFNALELYVSKYDVNLAGYLTSIPNEYVTDDELHQVLVSYITEQELSECGYLTQHQSLEGLVNEDDLYTILSTYATKNYVDNAILNAEIGGGDVTIDLSYYLRKDELDSVLVSYVSDNELSQVLTSYVSKNELRQELTSYVTKTELSSQSYITSSTVENLLVSYVSQNDLTQALGSYVSYSYLESKHYLTEHQDLSDYATKAYVMDKIADVEAGVVDLSSYVSKTELSAQGYITSAAVGNMLASYVSYSYLYSYIGDVVNDIEAGTIDLSTYVSKAELSAQSYITRADVSQMGYVSGAEISQMGYITMNDVSNCGYVTYNINNTYTIPVWQGTYAQYTALPDHTSYKLYLIAQE